MWYPQERLLESLILPSQLGVRLHIDIEQRIVNKAEDERERLHNPGGELTKVAFLDDLLVHFCGVNVCVALEGTIVEFAILVCDF